MAEGSERTSNEHSAHSAFRLLEDVIILKRTDIFSGVETIDLRAIAAIAQEISVGGDEIIVVEGDVGESMYLIKDGKVTLSQGNGAHKHVVGELGPGGSFGDMAVLDAQLHPATAIASTPCLLLKISRDHLHDVLLACPHIALGLLRVFVKRLRSTDQKSLQIQRKD